MPNPNAHSAPGPAGTIIPGPRLIDGTDLIGILSGIVNYTSLSIQSSNGVTPAMLWESSQDSITANATGGQAAATPLLNEVNRIATAANASSPYASVLLPPTSVGGTTGSPGLTIMVINHGANPIQVFGTASDTIDDAASASGVSQMAGSVVFYTSTTSGAWYTEGLATGYVVSGGNPFQTVTFVDALSANSAGTQTAGTPITTSLAGFGTVGGAGYSATLPPALPGITITVFNETAATSMNVFPASQTQGGVSGGDSINNLTQNTALAVAGATSTIFACMTKGVWRTK